MRVPSGVSRSKLAWHAVAVVLVLSAIRPGPAPAAHAQTPPAKSAASSVSAEELRQRARQLFEQGEVGEALDVAGRAAETAPADPRSWVVLGGLQSIAGQEPEAHESYIACVLHASAHEGDECHAHPGDFAMP